MEIGRKARQRYNLERNNEIIKSVTGNVEI